MCNIIINRNKNHKVISVIIYENNHINEEYYYDNGKLDYKILHYGKIQNRIDFDIDGIPLYE